MAGLGRRKAKKAQSQAVDPEELGGGSGGFAKRYLGLIISISIFVLFIVGIMGLNLYSTNQLQKNSNLIGATGKMRDLIQTITKDLFNLKLSYGEDPESPNIKSSIQRLNNNTKQFDNYVNAMLEGGVVRDNKVRFRIFPLKTAKMMEAGTSMKGTWVEFRALIEEYLKTASDIRADSTNLDIAVNQAQSSALEIYQNIETMSTEIYQSSINQARTLQIAEIVGIVSAVIYFTLFLFYFVRKLLRADAVAEVSRQETSEIMQTVSEGLFLLDKNLTIGGQYSKELENIIGQRGLANRSLIDVLKKLVSERDLNITQQFINQLFKKRIKANLITDLNPLNKIKVEVDDLAGYKVSKFLNFKFKRVYTGKNISRVLVSVSDITNSVVLEERLAQEREQNDQQIEMLTTILNTDPVLMKSFMNTVKVCVDKVNNVLKIPSKSESELQEKTKDIYREIHNMKGEASALRLRNFVQIATQFEEKLKALQAQESLTGNDFLPLAMMLDELVNLSGTFEKLSIRIGVLEGPDGKRTGPGSFKRASRNVMQEFFENFTEEAAKRNHKKAVMHCHGMDDPDIPEEVLNVMREISIQLIRNSLVHGIENPEDRVKAGKDEVGNISLVVKRLKDGALEMIVEDDGKGLDFEKIREKAVRKGLVSADKAASLTTQQLIGYIFQSGFSTAEKANEDGGRGVGMDVIKDRIKQLKGNMKIATGEGKYLKFIITIPKQTLAA